MTVLLSKDEMARLTEYLKRYGGKKSTYAKKLILDDMDQAEEAHR